MALLDLPKSRRPSRTSTLSRDAEVLVSMAEQLNGRPVPGVKMSERQFEKWCDQDVRAEWQDGEVVLMTIASIEHGRIVKWLGRLIDHCVDRYDPGEAFGSDLMVRLPPIRRLRVPDVVFVAKPKLAQLRSNHFEGAPDLVIEVVSPDSVVRDWQTKYLEYETAGVREYWVVDPLIKRLEGYSLRSGQYKPLPTDEHGNRRSKVVRQFRLRDDWVFRVPLPKVETICKELASGE
jgi:Uma2 family endonuclease